MVELLDVLDENRNKTVRLHERGEPMEAGDCHLIVQIWIMNGNGKFLIQKRPGGKWETAGGCAVAGEDSISAALRETKEELGIDLTPKNGQLFKQYSEPHTNDAGTALFDIWLFR
jgi:8-oxo-dGTP pyrophosphatase MutT (NUDIX family)